MKFVLFSGNMGAEIYEGDGPPVSGAKLEDVPYGSLESLGKAWTMEVSSIDDLLRLIRQDNAAETLEIEQTPYLATKHAKSFGQQMFGLGVLDDPLGFKLGANNPREPLIGLEEGEVYKFAVNRFEAGFCILDNLDSPIKGTRLEKSPFGIPPFEIRDNWTIELDDLDSMLKVIVANDVPIRLSLSGYGAGETIAEPGPLLFQISVMKNMNWEKVDPTSWHVRVLPNVAQD